MADMIFLPDGFLSPGEVRLLGAKHELRYDHLRQWAQSAPPALTLILELDVDEDAQAAFIQWIERERDRSRA